MDDQSLRPVASTKNVSRHDICAEPYSEFTRRVKTVLETQVRPGWVRGEVSNLRAQTSGHVYFSLKDAGACIDCVMWKSDAARVRFQLAGGMELLARGNVQVYAQQGKYQLYVSSLQPLGQGALELAFQQVRAKLEAEGLFSAERKRPLPRFPSRVVLVTTNRFGAPSEVENCSAVRRLRRLSMAGSSGCDKARK